MIVWAAEVADFGDRLEREARLGAQDVGAEISVVVGVGAAYDGARAFGVAVRLERGERGEVAEVARHRRGRIRGGARGCPARSASRRPPGSRRAAPRRTVPAVARPSRRRRGCRRRRNRPRRGWPGNELHHPDAPLAQPGGRVAHLRRFRRHQCDAVSAFRGRSPKARRATWCGSSLTTRR